MTKEEFIEAYAKNSELDPEELTDLGLQAAPCQCDCVNCQGWAMVHHSCLDAHFELYAPR